MRSSATSEMLRCIRFAAFGAWLDIATAFRFSRLGTIWRSIGLITLVGLAGVLFGALFKSNLRNVTDYVMDFAVGVVIWDFLSSTLNQSCAAFNSHVPSLRYSAQPVIAIPLRICFRNAFLLLQTVVLGMIVYVLVFGSLPRMDPALLPGLAAITTLVLAVASLALFASIRFRDLPQFVAWLTNIAFFLTPIIWPDYFLGRYLFLRDINPFYHIVELVRAPMTGTAPTTLNWIVGIAICGAAVAAAIFVHRRSANRIPYWL